jgi:hypothetical protein
MECELRSILSTERRDIEIADLRKKMEQLSDFLDESKLQKQI